MRVERFALFFPPLIAKVRRGETEYGIGAIPLGGYVKISGMNPAEELPPDVAHRAYYNQPVWKRIFVIGAGPAVNIVLAFVIMWVVFMHAGVAGGPPRVGDGREGPPAAAAVLKPGDAIVAVDGRKPHRQTSTRRRRRSATRSRRTTARRSRLTLEPRRRDDGRPGGPVPRHQARRRAKWRIGFGQDGDRPRRHGPSAPARRLDRDVGAPPAARSARSRRSSSPRSASSSARRRRLRGDATVDQLLDDARADRCWRSSRSRSASSTCSRSCRSTAATSSGRWPRRCAAARSRSRDGARRVHRLRARDRAVHDRPHERHRAPHRRRLRSIPGRFRP